MVKEGMDFREKFDICIQVRRCMHFLVALSSILLYRISGLLRVAFDSLWRSCTWKHTMIHPMLSNNSSFNTQKRHRKMSSTSESTTSYIALSEGTTYRTFPYD